tara:strand:+ start:393 stop:1076 length:684 start_codon:yes stop_codon:yes gene_type:complete
MLSLKQGLSLESIRIQGKWSPADESSLEAWYQKGEGITLNGSDVSAWADSSGTAANDMVQATATEQPAFSGGVLTFASADTNNLQTSGADIQLTGDFTIGVKLHLTASGGTLLGDNTLAGEFVRFTGTTELRVRVASATAVNIDKDSGTFLEDAYMVLTRSSDVMTLYWKGVAQADTETKAGTASIDAIGVRKTDTNPYEGTISEIQIFSSSNATLIANINDRLAGL